MDASLSSVGLPALLLSTENLFPWEIRHLWNYEKAAELLDESCFSVQLRFLDVDGADAVVDVVDVVVDVWIGLVDVDVPLGVFWRVVEDHSSSL